MQNYFKNRKKKTFWFEIEKMFSNKIVSKFDFTLYRLLKFSKSPILKSEGFCTLLGWEVPSRRLGQTQTNFLVRNQKKNVTNKIVSKFDFTQFRHWKYSNIKVLRSFAHFWGEGLISAIGKFPNYISKTNKLKYNIF